MVDVELSRLGYYNYCLVLNRQIMTQSVTCTVTRFNLPFSIKPDGSRLQSFSARSVIETSRLA